MKGPNEPNGRIEIDTDKLDEDGKAELDIGVRAFLEDGHVEIILGHPETGEDDLGSLYVDANGSELDPKSESAAHELAEHVEQRADK